MVCPPSQDPLDAYLEAHRGRFLDGLCDLVRQPTVSTDPAYARHLVACAERLRQAGASLGFEAWVEPTPRHPCVIWRGPRVSGAPTALIYGHYDVQPAEDEALWRTPPFEPKIEGRQLFGRGASDNKGQIWAHLSALEALSRVRGGLPLNVFVVIEGEEEIGSPHLPSVIARLGGAARFDVAVVSDTSTAVKGHPTLHYSLRGLAGFEVTLRTAPRDVHSGVFGGTLLNAPRELAALIARLHDADRRVTVPGFYDEVQAGEPWELEALAALPFDEEAYARWLGASLLGERGFSTNERRWFRPTLECNGLYGGYTGQGTKTIVPCQATAKFTARLVAPQEPGPILARLRRWFEEHRPEGCEIEFREGDQGRPYLLSREGAGGALFEAARRAVQVGFGQPPLLCRHGGAIPIVSELERILGAPTLLLGLGSPDDAIHAPNEKFELDNFFRGIRMSAALLEELALLRS